MAHPRRKKRTQTATSTQNARATGVTKSNPASRIPKSMVIRMGANDVGSSVSQLVRDMRQLMEPHTASKLQERKGNRLRDYTTMAGPLGVTHFLLFYRAKETRNVNMKIATTPRGPTLSFRVEKYSLAKDVSKAQKRPKTGNAGLDHLTPPLLVLNNFTTPQSQPSADPNSQPPPTANAIPKHLESLTTSVFQSLFPPISPQRTPLSTIRRIMLVNRDPPTTSSSPPPEQQPYVLNMRHYAISSKPILPNPLSRNLKRLERAKAHAQHNPYAGQARDYDYSAAAAHARRQSSKGALPNLGDFDDVADFLLEPGANGGYATASESEGEGTEAEVDVLAEPEAKRTWNRKDREEQRKRREALVAQRAEAQRDGEIDGEDGEVNGSTQKPKRRNQLPLSQKTQKRAIKLTEIGPRLRLRLYKVEEGLCSGRVLWHESVTKSKAEQQQLDETWESRNEEKERRRKEQRANLDKKRQEKEAQRAKDKSKGKEKDDPENGEEDESDEDLLDDDQGWDDEDEMELDETSGDYDE